MEEIILKELIGKITEQDKGLQAVRAELKAIPDHTPVLQQMHQRIDGLHTEIEDIPKRISLPETALQKLGSELRRHSELLERPVQQQIRHHHHTGKAVWIAIGLFVFSMVLIILLVNAWEVTRRHEATDMEYRFLKMNGSPGMVQALDYADSLYLTDPGKFGKWVEEQERVKRKEEERLKKLEEERKKVRELEKRDKE